MSITVEWQQLSKRYAAHTALDQINGRLSGDKIIGLAGRNGSGKTTLLSLMKGLLRPTSGEIRVNGQSPYENPALARQICFIRDSRMTYGNFKVKDTLLLAQSAWPDWDHDYAMQLIERFGLPLHKKVQSLSLGMESSLGAILGLATRAPLTLFDETYNGMDAPSRYLFYEEILADYIRVPRMIVLSTHLIEEAGRLFEEVVLVDEGKVVLHEETEELLMRAYMIIGAAADVDRYTSGDTGGGVKVLHTQQIGNTKSAIIFGLMTPEQERLTGLYHLDVQAVPLQDIIVHLSGKGGAVR